MLDFVVWSFAIVAAPLALGVAWHLAAAAVQCTTSALRGPSAWADESGLHPPYV